ncbi:major histocompatibility complex class I-related gene protein-like [Oncorhynchus clarkii lewisi]|uniref:major histocompatibility complex class I-related gene protein-like n=1 Tax=Oncorhynchus clarkii lewisi TaxID=490388 RepID=UPI0039B89F82
MVLVNGNPFSYYDSNISRMTHKQEWIAKSEGPDYWERNIQLYIGNDLLTKTNLVVSQQLFNQTAERKQRTEKAVHCDDISTTLNLTRSLSLPLSLSGVHIYQVMYGCEWDEETGITDVLFQYGHDREDFISFDLKTMTWVTPKPQAVITKHKYDSNIAVNEGYKHYLTQRCITCLKKYLQNGKSTLQRIVSPPVSILQKTPSSPVVTCHATGFYPRGVMVMRMRGEKDIHEDVKYGETLPNHDGIFQMRSRMTVDPKEWDNNNT